MRGLCGPGSVTPAKSRCLQKSRLCRGFSDPWTVASGTMQSWEPRPVAWDPGGCAHSIEPQVNRPTPGST